MNYCWKWTSNLQFSPCIFTSRRKMQWKRSEDLASHAEGMLMHLLSIMLCKPWVFKSERTSSCGIDELVWAESSIKTEVSREVICTIEILNNSIWTENSLLLIIASGCLFLHIRVKWTSYWKTELRLVQGSSVFYCQVLKWSNAILSCSSTTISTNYI